MSVEPTTEGPPAVRFEKGASRAGIDVRRFPWIRPLSGEYAFNFERIASLFAGDPASPEAWRTVISRVQAQPRRRDELVAVLRAQQERRGAPHEARAALDVLARPDAVAVVTGQQAGAFGGPMYTLLKALTAVQLARRISEEQGVPVVPVFWAEGEDHDWAEIAGCTLLDAEFQPHTITLASPDGAGTLSVASLTFDDRIQQSLDEVARILPQTPFTPGLLESLRATYRPGASVSTAFAAWIELLLGKYGVVVYESADPAAKPLAAPVFARELSRPGAAAARAIEAGQAMSALGHAAQVEPHPDQPLVFHIDGARTSIKRTGGEFTIGERTVPANDLIAQAEQSPQAFSPNVLLRPIVQDTLFPTISYVAGPSEMAYLGQMAGVYEEFGLPMPLIYARATATLVDSAAARFLRKHTVDLEALQPQNDSALNRLLESQLPPAVDHAMRDAADTMQRVMARVAEALPQLDPTLAGAAKTTLGKMTHDLHGLQSKIIHAAKKRNETLRRQFTRVQAQIFPTGAPQERVLAIVFFLNQYGPALVDRLLDELPLDMGQHWILTI